MKNVNKIFLPIIVATFAFAACENMLEEEAYDFMNGDNYYRNQSDAIAAIDGVYATAANDKFYGAGIIYLTSVAAHTGYTTATGEFEWLELESLLWDTDNNTITGIYRLAYQIINRSNSILENVPEIEDIDLNVKNRIVAEAHFFRGMAYFTLVRLYQNVPFVTESTKDLSNLFPTNQNTEDEVWNLVINDFKKAASDLPEASEYSGSDVGRVTSGAAKGFLAKVYLHRSGIGKGNEYTQAASLANEIIQSGEYRLFDDFKHNFLLDYENQTESIFEIQLTGGINTTGLWSATGVGGVAPSLGEGWSGLIGDTLFFQSWDQNDKRYDATWYIEYEEKGDTIRYPSNRFKYPGVAKYKAGFITDFPDREGANIKVLRYADVLLMHSEAVNESEGPVDAAYTGINLVRERAGLEPLSGLTKEELQQAVRRERELELCFEGHEFYDLQRYGTLVSSVQHARPDVESYRTFLPIPRHEMDNNANLQQNEGY